MREQTTNGGKRVTDYLFPIFSCKKTVLQIILLHNSIALAFYSHTHSGQRTTVLEQHIHRMMVTVDECTI